LVQRFYHEVWNEADETVAREILHADLHFKASLGPVRTGLEGFIDYMRSLHAGLAGYRCVIDDLIETDTRAAARLRFRGTHRGSSSVCPRPATISNGSVRHFLLRMAVRSLISGCSGMSMPSSGSSASERHRHSRRDLNIVKLETPRAGARHRSVMPGA
jgi:hypothetical protein